MKVLALLAAATSPAHAAEPAMTGLWEGSIGRYPIIACFDTGGFQRGSYYYRKVLVPIGLWHDDDTNTWSEGLSSRADPVIWSISVASNGELTGTWRQKDRELPIRLKRQEWSKHEDGWGNPCDSSEYQAA